jgi:hypothetical protein
MTTMIPHPAEGANRELGHHAGQDVSEYGPAPQACATLVDVTSSGDLLLVARLHVDLQRVISAACPA